MVVSNGWYRKNVNLYSLYYMCVILQGTYSNSSVVVQHYALENVSNSTIRTHRKPK